MATAGIAAAYPAGQEHIREYAEPAGWVRIRHESVTIRGIVSSQNNITLRARHSQPGTRRTVLPAVAQSVRFAHHRVSISPPLWPGNVAILLRTNKLFVRVEVAGALSSIVRSYVTTVTTTRPHLLGEIA
jgi:hypothetical protein